jgi:hypothetical protein
LEEFQEGNNNSLLKTLDSFGVQRDSGC